MGFTLLIFACLAGDNCRPVVVAGGFVHPAQCEAYRPLMLDGWKAEHPEAKVERWICTESPERIIGAWMT